MLQKRVSEISPMNSTRFRRTSRVWFPPYLKDAQGQTIIYQLVMPEDADPDHGMISTAPIGQRREQGRGRRSERDDAEWQPAIRSGEAGHRPRRGKRTGVITGQGSPSNDAARASARTALLDSVVASPSSSLAPARQGRITPGVLRALHEAGIKIDPAGRGAGARPRLFAAIDGSSRLWEASGIWKDGSSRRLYGWRLARRFAGYAVGLALMLLCLPMALLLVAVLVGLAGMLATLVGLGGVGKCAHRDVHQLG